MSGKRKYSDRDQLELDFNAVVRAIKEARAPKAGPKSLPGGALDLGPQVAAALHAALQKAAKAGKSREQVAEEVSHLVGRKVTAHMLNNYVSRAGSKDPYRMPVDMVNALCQACDDYDLIRLLCRMSKFEAVGAEELAYMKLGRLHVEKEQIAREEKEVRKRLGDVL